MQINPTNKIWKKKTDAPSLDALAGTDLQATTWCIEAGVHTLLFGANYCHKKYFFKYWQRAMWTMYATGARCHPWSRRAAHRSRVQNNVAYTKWEPTEEHHRLIEGVLKKESNEQLQQGPRLQDGGTR